MGLGGAAGSSERGDEYKVLECDAVGIVSAANGQAGVDVKVLMDWRRSIDGNIRNQHKTSPIT
jgi:hypothetical protein